jgi:lactoylglutathione lyase
MQLAKNVIDVGLSTTNLEPMLRCWQQQDVTVRFDHALPVLTAQIIFGFDLNRPTQNKSLR